MNKEVKEKWLKALRDGNYKQGYDRLKDGDCFCCLGVLCDLYAKEHNEEWRNDTIIAEHQLLPEIVKSWAGLKETSPEIFIDDKNKKALSALNDGYHVDHKYTFEEIADLIEEQL